jgi:hypothetical protein
MTVERVRFFVSTFGLHAHTIVCTNKSMDLHKAAGFVTRCIYKAARAKRLECWLQMFERLPNLMARHEVRYRHKATGRTFRNFWVVDPLKKAGGLTYQNRRRELQQKRLDDGLTSRQRMYLRKDKSYYKDVATQT